MEAIRLVRSGNVPSPPVTTFLCIVVACERPQAFCPIFRLHGSRQGPQDHDVCDSHAFNEVWSFGDMAYGAITKVMAIRESLRPYVAAQIELASNAGTPVLRPMVFDFADPECVTATDQYMFGPTYLVAPVLEYQATNRTVYLPNLPPGEKWVDYFAGAESVAVGPGRVHVATTDIDVFPLFMRTAAER